MAISNPPYNPTDPFSLAEQRNSATDMYPYGLPVSELAKIRQGQLVANATGGSTSNASALGGPAQSRKLDAHMRVVTIQNGYLLQFGSGNGFMSDSDAIFAATPAELAEKITAYLTAEVMKTL